MPVVPVGCQWNSSGIQAPTATLGGWGERTGMLVSLFFLHSQLAHTGGRVVARAMPVNCHDHMVSRGVGGRMLMQALGSNPSKFKLWRHAGHVPRLYPWALSAPGTVGNKFCRIATVH